MFKAARIKLTLWYTLSIMLVSLLFSLIIYKLVVDEVNRFERLQRFRLERFFNRDDFYLELGLPRPPPSLQLNNPQLISETQHRIEFILLGINSGILLFALILGYLLAGRTLLPIQAMVDDQNRFVSDASHELRTPLTALKTSLEVGLRDPKLHLSEAKTLISESLLDINTLQSLSDQMLTLVKNQYHSVKPAQVQLDEIITQAIRTVSPLAKQKHIRIDPHIVPATVWDSSGQIINLFTILLDNAIKYSSTNQVVTISSYSKDHCIFVSIADQGCGIASKDLPFIFDRFYRADSSRCKSAPGGFGLGLAIAKKIVTDNHGTISVTSSPESGTVFTIKLPA